jgi:hypothetical protein
MIKALDVKIKYGDIEDSLTIYTENIETSLTELMNQSYLPSSTFPVKLYMGQEYVTKTVKGMTPGYLSKIREELKNKVGTMTDSKIVMNQLCDAIETAQEWFGN